MDRLTIFKIYVFTFVLGLAILSSCFDNKIDAYPEEHYIVIIEGCQYFRFPGYTYTHKGNCTNSIHLYKESK